MKKGKGGGEKVSVREKGKIREKKWRNECRGGWKGERGASEKKERRSGMELRTWGEEECHMQIRGRVRVREDKGRE